MIWALLAINEILPTDVGAEDFVNNEWRYILALQDATPHELRALPEVMKRIESVKRYRLGELPARKKVEGGETKAKKRGEGTVELAAFPTKYHVTVIPKVPYLVLVCALDKANAAAPEELAQRIKERIRNNVGDQITCSIGLAANRLLAKIACKVGKPNGVTIWHPHLMPDPLFRLPIDDIPGVGRRMQERLTKAKIVTIKDLWNSQPKQLRALWGNVTGERMWYALHGYDIKAMPTARGMYGHARVLPPNWRDPNHVIACARLLLTKAARRMRRDSYCAGKLWLWLDGHDGHWFGQRDLPSVQDDHACLAALAALWGKAQREVPKSKKVIRVGVTLAELTPANCRQLDLLLNDDKERQRCETITHMIDGLNRKFGKCVLTLGPWMPPPGGYAGGKIAYNRIPSAEDFW